MKIFYDSDKEEEFIEIQLTQEEIKKLNLQYPVSGICEFTQEFKKPINIFIRKK